MCFSDKSHDSFVQPMFLHQCRKHREKLQRLLPAFSDISHDIRRDSNPSKSVLSNHSTPLFVISIAQIRSTERLCARPGVQRPEQLLIKYLELLFLPRHSFHAPMGKNIQRCCRHRVRMSTSEQ
jgi:hypothetical protein